VVKTTNVKKGFAIDILYIIIIVAVAAAIIVFFWMSQTGALNKIADEIGSLLSFGLP
jgi:flagellar basal body-associated protein FliL